MVLEFLLRECARTDSQPALSMVAGTASAMARGGMYDQLGGGFARYSVDAHWVVPHFEKMLYDNALLLRVYTNWWRASGEPLAARIAQETADWLIRELQTPQRGFASALDADSEGAEGRFYVWTPAELTEVLGAEEGAWAASLFGVTDAGTFEHGSSVLQLRVDPDDTARYRRVRSALLAHAIAGSGRGVTTRWSLPGTAWPSPRWQRPARCSSVRITSRPRKPPPICWYRSTWVRVSTAIGWSVPLGMAAPAHPPVCWRTTRIAEGCWRSTVTGEDEWLTIAGGLLDVAVAHFGDGAGGFYRHRRRRRRR
jgi:uncharacterized protein YyaL (SSP411 family)